MNKIFNKTPLFNSEYSQSEPFITPYLLEGKNNPCIVVCPGGGYWGLAAHEYFNDLFNSMGLSVFVLNYRCAPYSYPCQLLDIKRAIRYVKYNAEKFGIDRDRVLVAGSSAGGHLALSACCYADADENGDEIDKISSSVCGAVLCYPVVSLCEYTHDGTSQNFSAGNEEIKKKFSIQNNVHENMPPLFVWHTLEDNTVDVNNVLMLAKAYRENNIPMELHIFPHGAHGLGEAKDIPLVKQWTTLCKNWLEYNHFI